MRIGIVETFSYWHLFNHGSYGFIRIIGACILIHADQLFYWR
jgi:hypothetical protein